MVFNKPDKYECNFCGDGFPSIEAAEDHVKDEHDDEIVDEHWGVHVSEK